MPTPLTEIRTSHALSIKAAGVVIGQIQTWNPNQGRDVKPKFEINAIGTGAPLENVPGIATGLTIQIARYDLYIKKMEDIWGLYRPIHMLTDQHNPIDVEEKWIRFGSNRTPSVISSDLGLDRWNIDDQLNNVGSTPFGKNLGLGNSSVQEGTIPSGVDVYVEKNWYSGCWFTNLGRTYSATGDRIVNVNATLAYVKKRPLL